MTAKSPIIQTRNISYAEIERYMAAGRAERSKAVHQALKAVGRGIATLFDLHAVMQKKVSFEPTVKVAPKH